MVDVVYIVRTTAKEKNRTPIIEGLSTLGVHYIIAPNVRTALGLLNGRTPKIICCDTPQIARLRRSMWAGIRNTPVVSLGTFNSFLHMSEGDRQGIVGNISPTVQHNAHALRHALSCILIENGLMHPQPATEPLPVRPRSATTAAVAQLAA